MKLQEGRDHYKRVMREEGQWTDSIDLDMGAPDVRMDPTESHTSNSVCCWPSTGGIIIASGVHPVELEYIGVDRFHLNEFSSNQTEEDGFCMKLRKIGGMWWEDYYDHDWATGYKMRKLSVEEREVLFLGWPEDGGVWILRFENSAKVRNRGWHIGIINNALTMEERCKAIEIAGGTYYEKPEDCECVRPLLEGFGAHKPRGRLEEEEGWRDLGTFEEWDY